VDAPYRHIACCVDLSPATEAGVAEAARLRALGPGRLTLIHVFRYPTLYGSPWEPDMGGLLESAERWLAARAAAAPGAETVMLEGIPGEEAVAWAEAHGVDLIVAATHHGAARRAVLGSFAHHLLHHAPCPVLVVRGRDEEGTQA
jgi:nucleotide-binding universal stress UspA family protein